MWSLRIDVGSTFDAGPSDQSIATVQRKAANGGPKVQRTVQKWRPLGRAGTRVALLAEDEAHVGWPLLR